MGEGYITVVGNYIRSDSNEKVSKCIVIVYSSCDINRKETMWEEIVQLKMQ